MSLTQRFTGMLRRHAASLKVRDSLSSLAAALVEAAKHLEALQLENGQLKARVAELEQFNKLTAAESERLYVVVEEMGESLQAIGKSLRHGYESRHPKGGPTNREWVTRELGDVSVGSRMLVEAGDLNEDLMRTHANAKQVSVKKYLHHQERIHGN